MTRSCQDWPPGVYVVSRHPGGGEIRPATAGELARFRSPNPWTRLLESAPAGVAGDRLLVEVHPGGARFERLPRGSYRDAGWAAFVVAVAACGAGAAAAGFGAPWAATLLRVSAVAAALMVPLVLANLAERRWNRKHGNAYPLPTSGGFVDQPNILTSTEEAAAGPAAAAQGGGPVTTSEAVSTGRLVRRGRPGPRGGRS